MKTIKIYRYEEACEGYEGFCVSCQAFTRGETEPDAEGYPCPECEENTVMGAEQALICGEITVE